MQAWNEHSQSNKDRAEAEMARSQKLRELIFHLIEQTTNDLRVQGRGSIQFGNEGVPLG